MVDKVSELIIEQLHLPEGTVITEDTNFKDDLHADSFELMEMIMAVEEEYGIQFEDDELAGFETVGDVLNNIRSKGVDIE